MTGKSWRMGISRCSSAVVLVECFITTVAAFAFSSCIERDEGSGSWV